MRRHPPKRAIVINSPLIFWLIVFPHNYVLLLYSTLTLILFIPLPPDIVSSYDFIIYSLSIGSLSTELSEGRHWIKTRDWSPKWLFICLLSGLTLLWRLCACVLVACVSTRVPRVCVCVSLCVSACFPLCILFVAKMCLGDEDVCQPEHKPLHVY